MLLFGTGLVGMGRTPLAQSPSTRLITQCCSLGPIPHAAVQSFGSKGHDLTHRRILKRIRALKIKFDRAHENGQRALEARDYPALTKAIARERALIDEQHDLITRTVPRLPAKRRM
jgi:hypothetical protein